MTGSQLFALKFNKHFEIFCKGFHIFAQHSMTFLVPFLVCRFTPPSSCHALLAGIVHRIFHTFVTLTCFRCSDLIADGRVLQKKIHTKILLAFDNFNRTSFAIPFLMALAFPCAAAMCFFADFHTLAALTGFRTPILQTTGSPSSL